MRFENSTALLKPLAAEEADGESKESSSGSGVPSHEVSPGFSVDSISRTYLFCRKRRLVGVIGESKSDSKNGEICHKHSAFK